MRRGLPKLESVALAPIVRTILEAQEQMLSSHSLATELQLPEDLVVQGDAFLLHLALSNLLKNAIEFSPAGGLIRVHGERSGSLVRVVIEDEGPGIPDFAKERIFERFYSLERPVTGRKSTGLGLNFVKEIASLHHGSVELENRTERGLKASFTIADAPV